MLMKNSIVVLLATLVACDRSGDDLIPQPNGEFPAVIDIGELAILTPAQLQELRAEGSGAKAWCDNNLDSEGRQHCFYGILGQAEAGIKGGATFTFRGNGDRVCIVVDPETVFWNTSVANVNPEDQYSYSDLEEDDGDIDLFAGLSSYYTGSPGVELGNFRGFYTDSLGNSVEIEYGECFQYGAQTGMNNAHAGRAAAEYCAINTSNREDKLYTVVLESFSIPLDDGAMGFGAMVLQGGCSDYVIDECTLYGEGLTERRDTDGEIIVSETTGLADAFAKTCTVQLEQASCNGYLQQFCCEYKYMCGEDADVDMCDSLAEPLPAEYDCPSYCDAYGANDPDKCASTSE